jgi:hypothetical protein
MRTKRRGKEAVDLEDEVDELTQEMAAAIAEEMWASRVEQRLHAERRLARGAPVIAPPERTGNVANHRCNVTVWSYCNSVATRGSSTRRAVRQLCSELPPNVVPDD